MNVEEGKLTIDNCKITGQRQGLMVRCGEAAITDTQIVCTGEYKAKGFINARNSFTETSWGSGNEVPMAAFVVGNRSKNPEGTGYDADAVVKLTNCTITSQHAEVPAVYIWGNSENYSASLTYDAATTITNSASGTVFAGGGFATVNGRPIGEFIAELGA